MTTNSPEPADKAAELAALIEKSKSGRKWRWVIVALLVLGVGALVWRSMTAEPPPRAWMTEPLGRGDMVLSATATGDLKPKRTVTIGAEISGQILSVEVQANDRVEKGQVLLRFDTEALDNALLQANAALASARANQRGAQATLDAAKLDFARTKRLADQQMAARSALDQREADQLRAVASLEASRANVARAEAEVAAARTRLSKATITSPIDGVVMTQKVEGGNTVASTLQSPELFVLAEDLSQMILHIEVDEADIGLVKPGQKATFVVDAWPDNKFEAEVSTVSLSPTVEQNVVTYTVELSVDNSEELLRPGMTATATITTGVHENVLRAPNAALRFSPDADSAQSGGFNLMRMRPARERSVDKAAKSIWVLRADELVNVPVKTGPSDGRFTEITPLEADSLSLGDKVVLREKVGTDGANARGASPRRGGESAPAGAPRKQGDSPGAPGPSKSGRDARPAPRAGGAERSS